jgi:hypothetical protein
MKLHILIVLILGFTLIGCKFLKRSSPPIEVSAHQLIAEYSEQSIAADKKYNGQTLIITGNINHYFQLRGIIGVYLKDENATNKWQILCLIDTATQADAYSRLHQWETATFEGIAEPNDGDFFIRITDCKIK